MELINLINPEDGNIELHHMLVRGFLAYVFSLIISKIAGLRTFGRSSLTDNITVLVMGAIIGRSVVTSQPFFESMAAVLLIALLHRLSTLLSFKQTKFGELVKGKSIPLIQDGKMNLNNMEKCLITKNDLIASLRLKGNNEDIESIECAYLERSGEISIIHKKVY